jgi:hypothetical protein
MTESGIPDAFEAAKLAAEYQASLAANKFAQETQRDKTLVLVSGGALTVSFAFISTLIEHGAIIRLCSLTLAWVAWVGVLIFTIIGYGLSISDYTHVIEALSKGEWEKARQPPKFSKIIQPLNHFVSVLAVCGFILFGYFAIGNLTRMSNDKAQAISTAVHQKSKEGEQEVQGRPGKPCQLGPTAAVGIPEAPK